MDALRRHLLNGICYDFFFVTGQINHFHTGGNPGRNDIDETQELNYRFIMEQWAALNFTSFVTHEYTPKMGSDPIAVLTKAIEICDV